MTDEEPRAEETAEEEIAADEGAEPPAAAETPEEEGPEAEGAPPTGTYQDPAEGQLGRFGSDYLIPGVDPDDPDPYRWHRSEKRDHGGEDAIEVIDLVKQFGRMRILNGCNLGLPDDQISMVLGPSGTGKSVLIKHIVGLLYPDSGDVLVHGESV